MWRKYRQPLKSELWRNPILKIRLEVTPELAHLTPALEIIVGISALLKRNDLRQVAKQ